MVLGMNFIGLVHYFVTYLPLSSVVFQELKFAVFVQRQACSPFGHEEK